MRFLKSLGRRLSSGKRTSHTVQSEPRTPPSKQQADHSDATPRHTPHRKQRKRPQQTPTAQQKPTPQQKPAPQQKPWSIDEFVVEPEEGKTRFHDLDIPTPLMHAIADLGFKYCTPVQARTLPHAKEGRNIAGRAQTGTGKTAAFLVLIFSRFINVPRPEKAKPGTPRALIIAPTRELVMQVARDAEGLGKYCKFKTLGVYGGMDYNRQERALTEGIVDVIAATPGRLLDFCRRGVIDLKQVEVLVIDEADRMLDMGFIPDVKAIVGRTPKREHRQTMLFSATLTDDVMRLASQWMPDPVIEEVDPEHVAAETVDQIIYTITSAEKFKVLYNLLNKWDRTRTLIFTNRRTTAQRLCDELGRYDVHCEVLSGAVDQKKRVRILESFRSGKTDVVVATDVAGRGLHIEDISHVINFDLPYEQDDYVHRIGRTGRVGTSGTAVSFACEDESFIIPDIEEYIGRPLPCRQAEPELLEPLPAPKRAAPVREDRGRGGRPPARGRSGPRSGSRPRSPQRRRSR